MRDWRTLARRSLGTLDRVGAGALALLSSPGRLALCMLGLLLVHLAIHAGLFTGVPRDELEIIFWNQDWALGYDIQQPPLYNWVTKILLEGLGLGYGPGGFGLVRVLALALLFALIWAVARRMASGMGVGGMGVGGGEGSVEERRAAARRVAGLALVAALSTVMLGVQVFLNLTHSLAMLLATAFALWAMVRMAKPRVTLADYLLVGLALGLGALSKYNFVIFALGLLAAALSHPVLRARLLSWKTLAALGLSLLMLAPHGFWLLFLTDHTIASEASSLLKAREMTVAQRALSVLRTGVADPIAATIPPLILLLIARPRAILPGATGPADTDPSRPWRRFLVVYFAVSCLTMVAVTWIVGGTSIRDHYMIPAALAVPLWAALRFTATKPAPHQTTRAAALLGGGALVTALVLLLTMAVLRPLDCGRCLTELPIPTWEAEIRAQGFEGGLILAEDLDIAANLLPRFPGSRLALPDFPPPSGLETATTQGLLLLPRPEDATDSLPRLKAWLTETLGTDTWAEGREEVATRSTAGTRGSFGRVEKSAEVVVWR